MKTGKQKLFNYDYGQNNINYGFLPCTLFVLPQSNKNFTYNLSGNELTCFETHIK